MRNAVHGHWSISPTRGGECFLYFCMICAWIWVEPAATLRYKWCHQKQSSLPASSPASCGHITKFWPKRLKCKCLCNFQEEALLFFPSLPEGPHWSSHLGPRNGGHKRQSKSTERAWSGHCRAQYQPWATHFWTFTWQWIKLIFV